MSDLGEISFLPPLVERVRRLAPQIRLEASGLALDDIPDALASGALDLAVGFLPGLAAPVRRKRLRIRGHAPEQAFQQGKPVRVAVVGAQRFGRMRM